MEILPGSRTHDLIARLFSTAMGLLVAMGLAASSRAAEGVMGMIGSWHVLVHYRDDVATQSESESESESELERWDDFVWVFERTGSRLRWTVYPIVLFDDEGGRFEHSGTRQASRILHSWEPGEAQVEDIVDGLVVNARGSKSKTLREQDGIWVSSSRLNPGSASAVGYSEHWGIEAGESGLVFRRETVLGGEHVENLEGFSRYITQSIEAGGNVVRGTYEHDGTRHGTFRMMRSAGTTRLEVDRVIQSH